MARRSPMAARWRRLRREAGWWWADHGPAAARTARRFSGTALLCAMALAAGYGAAPILHAACSP